MLTYIFLAALLPTIIIGYPIKACSSGAAPLEIRIPQCPDSPCHVSGSEIYFEADFHATTNSETLTLRITTTLFGIEISYPIPAELANVCGGLSGNACPVEEYDFLSFAGTIPVVSLGTGLSVTLAFRVYDDNNDVVLCTLVDVIIG